MIKTKKQKLSLARETVRALKSSDMTLVAGGLMPETKYTYCGGDGCYKPNPY